MAVDVVAGDEDWYIRQADERNVTISHVIDTHVHADHYSGGKALAEQIRAKYCLHENADIKFHFEKLVDKQVIELGNVAVSVVHTPGHTFDSVCLLVSDNRRTDEPWFVITGDTLFVFGCGRCDMKGGSPEKMFQTLKTMKQKLPEDMLIHPGHNYSVKKNSTLGEQIEGNPFMHYEDEEQFIHYRMQVHDKTRDEPYASLSRQQLKIANLL